VCVILWCWSIKIAFSNKEDDKLAEELIERKWAQDTRTLDVTYCSVLWIVLYILNADLYKELIRHIQSDTENLQPSHVLSTPVFSRRHVLLQGKKIYIRFSVYKPILILLTDSRNTTWIKRPTRCHFSNIFISPL